MKRKNALVRHLQAADADHDDPETSETRSDGAQGPVDEEDLAKIFSAAPSLPRLSVKAKGSSAGLGDTVSEDIEERELMSPETPASPSGAATTPYAAVEELVVTGDRVPKLYCVLISMHGLVRGDAMELGKDADTGGQVRALGLQHVVIALFVKPERTGRAQRQGFYLVLPWS